MGIEYIENEGDTAILAIDIETLQQLRECTLECLRLTDQSDFRRKSMKLAPELDKTISALEDALF